MRLITSVAAGVLAVVAGWVLTGRAPEAQGIEPDPETVVYSSIRPPNWNLYLFEQPGSPPRRLTTNPGLDYNAAISPDGRWVVFTSERTGSPDLYRLRLDVEHPGAPQPLLATNVMEDAATFSPDGRTLVFVSTRDGSPDIFTMPFAPDDAGAPGEPINLTRHEAGDYNPVFSPDGTRILFSSSRDASDAGSATAAAANAYEASELYVMHADGTGVRRLTHHEGWDGSPAWTPEGESIAFYSERDGEPRIYRMREDGSGSRPVGAPGAAALSPAFGPDGRLAFTVRRDDRWTIVSAGPDGSDLPQRGRRQRCRRHGWTGESQCRRGRALPPRACARSHRKARYRPMCPASRPETAHGLQPLGRTPPRHGFRAPCKTLWPSCGPPDLGLTGDGLQQKRPRRASLSAGIFPSFLRSPFQSVPAGCAGRPKGDRGRPRRVR